MSSKGVIRSKYVSQPIADEVPLLRTLTLAQIHAYPKSTGGILYAMTTHLQTQPGGEIEILRDI